ncbi:MAG: ABC transporter ATP-binding protein [Betaproteobacteria bacterium]|nr:ABC transporter ATP-binding protein [Betaproteobacteria bacterium]
MRATIETEGEPVTASGAAQPRIRISRAGMRYDAIEVFRDVDLEVGDREVVAIIGPSGCGKTTLLRCIDGLLPLTAGELRVEGEPVRGPREGVAMVFQHFGLFPWKTVAQNVAYGLKMAGQRPDAIAAKVAQCIKLVGLAGFEHYYPHQVSGGMQQRCGLARALAVEPRVLLMDEPFGAVDAQTREILQFELLKIWEMRPTTMVFVTHSIDEAVLMGDRIVVLKGRPSGVHEMVEVDLPRPRSRATLTLPRFAQLREHVWSTLMADAIAAEHEVRQ